MFTRRDFGKITLAALPLATAFGKINSKINGVQLGVQTYSFRDLPQEGIVDAVIHAMTEIGLGECEVFASQFEPAQPRIGGPGGGRGRGTPPDPAVVAAREKARNDLRDWRLSVSMDHFKGLKKKFDDAGINIYAYTVNYNTDFTDPEIDKTFEQAKAMGVNTIASSTKVSMTKRLLGFADHHKVYLAFHGHAEYDKPDEFSTPATFQQALDMSKYAKVNLDIGHYTAANLDPIAYIEEHHDRISHLHMKDRKKNKGENVEWGNGDTPIKEVLVLLRDKKYPLPAFIEYEYKGTGTSIEEVKKCMAYMRQALA